MNSKLTLRLLIYGLLLLTFFAGFPQFHYAVAVMIGVLIRHRAAPGGLFAPVGSYNIRG